MTKTDARRGNRPRISALCCDCGHVRAVAMSYRGKKPEHASERDHILDPSCRWLRCSTCRVVTAHVVVDDQLPVRRDSVGCDRESHNRATDRQHRRIARRLAAFEAEGIVIRRAVPSDRMLVDGAVLEVLEYDGKRGLEIRISAAAETAQILRGLEAAEDVIDELSTLGESTPMNVGGWRGVAWRG